MLVRKLLAGIAALAIVLTGLTVTASATAGEWGDALPVPGLAALNVGNSAEVKSVSCTSPGNCSAVGAYNDGSAQQGFLVDRVGGAWQQAVPVPGLGALDVGRNSAVRGVSCSSDGNCSAVGSYSDGSRASAFVVDRVGGVWQNAVPIPGVAALAIGPFGIASFVSCTSDGNCSALGGYADGSGYFQLFVVDRVAGVWQDAIPVPGFIALNQYGEAELGGISCSSDGNCSAGGNYETSFGNYQGFVVDRVGGVWQTAAPIPGLQTLNVANHAGVRGLSCSSAGSCSAVGYFSDGSGLQGFVVDRVGGVWQSAVAAPGLASLGTQGGVDAISCSSDGNCAAGGVAIVSDFFSVTIDRVDGVWQSAQLVPGLAALGTVRSGVWDISCWSPSDCSATGGYDPGTGYEGYVVDRVGGVWQSAAPIPGLASLDGGHDSSVYGISCVTGGACSTVGRFNDGAGNQGFVADRQLPPEPTTTTTSQSLDPAVPVFTG